MAAYDPKTKTIGIRPELGESDAQLIELIKEYASLVDDTINSVARRILREVLPSRIAQERERRKQEMT